MRLNDLLSQLVATAPTAQVFTQGCNSHGGNQRFHIGHPNGRTLQILKTIAEEASELLQELNAALPKPDLPSPPAEEPTAAIVAPEAASAQPAPTPEASPEQPAP